MGTLCKVAPAMMLLFTFCLSGATKAIADHKPPTCIDTPPYDNTPTPAQQKEATRRRAQGATLQELADSYNVGVTTIRRVTRPA